MSPLADVLGLGVTGGIIVLVVFVGLFAAIRLQKGKSKKARRPGVGQ